MSLNDSDTPGTQSSAASSKGKPDVVTLKDVLKPSSLIIALMASVLLILFGWYLYVLKPALSQSNPMDIRLTKKSSSNTPFPQELISKTEVETQTTDGELQPTNHEVFEIEGKSEVVLPNKPTSPVKSTNRTPSTKSSKSNIGSSKKVATVQNEDTVHPENEVIQEDTKPVNVNAEIIRPKKKKEEDKVVSMDVDTGQKIKAFATKWKESILIPATQPICTQVQIAMNQCPN